MLHQGVVDTFFERALDPSFEQVCGLVAGLTQLDSPALEHLRPRGELFEWQLDRPQLESRGLRAIVGRSPSETGDGAQQQSRALLTREPSQAGPQRLDPVACAGAHREQLRVVVLEQLRQR